MAVFFGVAATTGARCGQVVALRWDDILLHRGTISFSRSICEEPDGRLVVVPTKNRRRNRVELDPATVVMLADHRVEIDRRALAAGVDVGPDAYEFSYDSNGRRPWRPEYVTKRFAELRDEVGLTGHRLHDLRHFMATEMINAGVPIPIVSNRLAHARSSTTMNVYAHAVPGGDRDAAIGLAGLLDI